MIDNLSLDEVVAFIDEALKMEYDGETHKVKDATMVMKHSTPDTIEMTIRGMVGNKCLIFDVYFDDKWVGVNWVTEITKKPEVFIYDD